MATDSEKSDWERSDWDRSDIDDISHATPDQLKQVVLSLKTYVQRIVETHEHERNEMKEKIEALERESIRKDDEIKGLKYLVHRGGGAPFGAASPRAGSPRTSSARSSPLATPSNTSFSDTEKMPTRRRVTIVSGTQSDTGRGGVMTSDSEVDGPSSIPMLPPSLRRNKTTAPAAPRPIASWCITTAKFDYTNDWLDQPCPPLSEQASIYGVHVLYGIHHLHFFLTLTREFNRTEHDFIESLLDP
ncbi:hypothetical protein ONZ45_g14550 [Pleurotus djamor]|nr:hypothetical protein ONZ45_g14550 [Pleurotus djamor]